MSMLFLPCQDCGVLVGRTSANRHDVRCGPCTKEVLKAPDHAPGHAARLDAHVRRMELVKELCEDSEVDLGKAGADQVDEVLARV